MPDAESFIAAIAANPADDLPRLVYADWLDENGDPTRAGFIRDHVALAKLRPGTDEYKTLFLRCADTLKANLPAWIQPACAIFGRPTGWKPRQVIAGRFGIELEHWHMTQLPSLEFSRGFIGSVTLNLLYTGDLKQCEMLTGTHPITRVIALFPPNPLPDIRTSTFLQRVQTLILAALPTREIDAVELFNSPQMQAVSQLFIGTATHAKALVRSMTARRIKQLRTLADTAILRELAEFPLDDRLQEFGIAPPGRNTPAVADWSAVSRVAFRPTLKRLDLTRCGMTDDGLAAFARGEEWVRLQGLKLGGNLFGDRGWADFCRGWRTPELTYLDASRNRLTDAGAEMLARSGMLKTLRVIDLRGNHIAGRGVVALARAVAEGKVHKLLLAGNPVGKREAATVKGLLGERVDLG